MGPRAATRARSVFTLRTIQRDSFSPTVQCGPHTHNSLPSEAVNHSTAAQLLWAIFGLRHPQWLRGAEG